MKVFIGILIFLAVITVITLIRAIILGAEEKKPTSRLRTKRCSLMSIVGI